MIHLGLLELVRPSSWLGPEAHLIQQGTDLIPGCLADQPQLCLVLSLLELLLLLETLCLQVQCC
jgi:hypothetical protein